MSEKSEQILQIKLCSYIKNFYPNVYFSSDPSGLRVTMGLRSLLKATRSRHAQLDITILEPRNGRFGLIIELKKESPWKSTGGLKKDKHLEDQYESLRHLLSKGYKTEWCWSFEMGKDILEQYLGPPVQEPDEFFDKYKI